MSRVVIGAAVDFPDGCGVAIEVEGRRLAVFRLGERVFAIDDRCSHRGFPLHDGVLEQASVRCRTHGACFDLTTGAVLRGPARRAVRCYAAAVIEGNVVIEV